MEASVERILTGDPALANRYLADQMSDEERTAFEERMVTDPALLRELELTARFKAGLAHLQQSGELATVLQRRRSGLPWMGAVAASLLVVAFIGVLRWDRGEPVWLAAAPSMFAGDGGQTLPTGRSYRVMRVRAVEQGILISLPRERQAIALQVLPDSDGAMGRYDARLRRIDAGTATPADGVLRGLQADADGFVTVFVDSGRAVPGSYQLELSTVGPDGAVAPAGSFLIQFNTASTEP